MKVKNKGKLYSSLSSSSSSPSYKDANTVLKLLPLTILALTSSLPVHDQEVIAYMITRSIFTTTTSSTTTHKNNNKKPNHKNPIFDCGCFDCYTIFWYRWDSSPNRDLIHQVLEAFEDHLLQNESSKKQQQIKGNNNNNKKEKLVVVKTGKIEVTSMPEKDRAYLEENVDVYEEKEEEEEEKVEMVTVQVVKASVCSSRHHHHHHHQKGLARKVLPDVMGLLNSRLWSLWSPTI